MIGADPVLVGPPVDWFALSPLLVMLGAAVVLLVLGALFPRWPRHLYALFTAAARPRFHDPVLLLGTTSPTMAPAHW
jgi:hypothetical protein